MLPPLLSVAMNLRVCLSRRRDEVICQGFNRIVRLVAVAVAVGHGSSESVG